MQKISNINDVLNQWVMKFLGEETDTISVFIYKLNSDYKKFDKWLKKHVKSYPEALSLLTFVSKHRTFYEALSPINCGHGQTNDPYSESCLSNDLKLKNAISKFWKASLLPDLKNEKLKSILLNEDIESYYQATPIQKLMLTIYDESLYYYGILEEE